MGFLKIDRLRFSDIGQGEVFLTIDSVRLSDNGQDQGCRKWQDGQENQADKLSSVGQFGFEEHAKSVLLTNYWIAIDANDWTVLCQTVQLPDRAVSNSPMYGQCSVQQSHG